MEKTLESPLDCKEIHQSILKEISPGISLEGMMLKLKLQYFGHLMRITDLGFSLNKISTPCRHKSPAQAVSCASNQTVNGVEVPMYPLPSWGAITSSNFHLCF